MDLFVLTGRIAIDATEATQKIDATITAGKDLETMLNGLGTKTDDTSKKFGSNSKFGTASVWLGNTLTKLGEKAAKVVTDLGKTGLDFNTSMESYQYQFEALLSDADKASQLIADLQELAKISPLGMEGLANNATTLLQQGIELADIIPTLEMLGNLSLGNTDRMNSVVRAYTQIIGKGGLMAQEMYQLGDAMVPIIEIMTKYGGERYEDGSWYQEKMTDPTYKIPAEDMIAAFTAATAEGGKWHDYMFTIMDSFGGQADRLGEEGKETLGAFFQPFFEMAKSDVLPNLTASLESFRTWVAENKDTIEKMADAIGNLVNVGFEKMLDMFKWITENGEAVGVALGVIAAGLAAGAIAAHPYASAVLAVAAGLMWLWSAIEEQPANAFSAYTEEEIALLQQYHDACKAAQKAREEYNSADEFDKAAAWENVERADANVSDALARIDMQTNGDEMLRTYNEWISKNADAFALDIPAALEEGTETDIQAELDGMTFNAVVKMMADTSALPDEVYSIASGDGVDGSHASGLWRVPKDGYIARLHKGEAVLTAAEAAVWRSGMNWNGSESSSRTRKTSASNDQPITVNLTVNGVSGSPYEIAGEVRNALELMRWQS